MSYTGSRRDKETARRCMARLRKKQPDYARRANLKRLYGMTLEQFEQMLSDQKRQCKACGRSDPGGKGSFHVDRCHRTGKIRGLLCHWCNVALGHANDDLRRLNALVRYLQENG